MWPTECFATVLRRFTGGWEHCFWCVLLHSLWWISYARIITIASRTQARQRGKIWPLFRLVAQNAAFDVAIICIVRSCMVIEGNMIYRYWTDSFLFFPPLVLWISCSPLKKWRLLNRLLSRRSTPCRFLGGTIPRSARSSSWEEVTLIDHGLDIQKRRPVHNISNSSLRVYSDIVAVIQ